MGDVQAAVGFDRLPWLADEPQPRPRGGRQPLIGWALAAMLVIASASFWLGSRSVIDNQADVPPDNTSPPLTIPLPAPRETGPAQPQVAPERIEQIAPIAPAPALAPPARLRASGKNATSSRARAHPPARARQADPAALWPVRVEAGASGRMVRIGTFATRRQAKTGWARIMRLYPGMRRLPTLVVPMQSLRDRRIYYRLQMGTSSQAHSEVLCQRMRMIAQSCVVVDLPVHQGAAR